MKHPFPQRLVEGDDRTARVLRAELEYGDAASPPDFEVLRARRARGQVRMQRLLAAALALGTATLFFATRTPTPEFSITREAAFGPGRPRSEDDGRPVRAAPASASAETHSTLPSEPIRELAHPQPAPTPKHLRPALPPTSSESDCKTVVSTSGYEAGARCYGEKAKHGSGVGAELAWMERARIESRALGRPNDALETLAAYGRRFPNGTLSTEARLTSIELLAAVGRRDEALRAIAEAAPRIPERAGSLHLLGARLAIETDSCTLALSHLDAAVRANAPADRVSALRRSTTCFTSTEPTAENN